MPRLIKPVRKHWQPQPATPIIRRECSRIGHGLIQTVPANVVFLRVCPYIRSDDREKMHSDRNIFMLNAQAKFNIGQIVRHRKFPFRGVVFDVDPEFSNTDEWWESIPEDIRPVKEQPFYHLLAENEQAYYVAYVSEQNLVLDKSGKPLNHPGVSTIFGELSDGKYDFEPRLN